ncbi:hypothetical protein EYF80_001254 [Liparis tanakae]|uniref:Uncharacterized protein n=1 Tax=Liparis tanakae TaxID=230148 RepID=A0A4Z2JGV4_9TELE|nr:hypothetical protein EYF80_001254 [Liparis tanakae]
MKDNTCQHLRSETSHQRESSCRGLVATKELRGRRTRLRGASARLHSFRMALFSPNEGPQRAADKTRDKGRAPDCLSRCAAEGLTPSGHSGHLSGGRDDTILEKFKEKTATLPLEKKKKKKKVNGVVR